MLKLARAICSVTIAGLTAVTISLPLISFAQAKTIYRCKHVDPISHRCTAFRSDSTWPQGYRRGHTSNGA